MRLVTNIKEMWQFSSDAKKAGKSIVFVPTMGCLHEGHASLLKKGRELGDILVMSIFVNPTQFGPKEDYASYPRDWEMDMKLAKVNSVDVVFNPVYTKQLARIIKYILDKKHAVGVLNVGSAQFLNKHEFLKFLAQNFGISREAIKPALIGSSVLETARPKNTTLNTSKLQEIIKGKTSELSLPKGLAEFKKDYLKEFKRL